MFLFGCGERRGCCDWGQMSHPNAPEDHLSPTFQRLFFFSFGENTVSEYRPTPPPPSSQCNAGGKVANGWTWMVCGYKATRWKSNNVSVVHTNIHVLEDGLATEQPLISFRVSLSFVLSFRLCSSYTCRQEQPLNPPCHNFSMLLFSTPNSLSPLLRSQTAQTYYALETVSKYFCENAYVRIQNQRLCGIGIARKTRPRVK